MLGFIDQEFNYYNMGFITKNNLVSRGWNIENNGGLEVKITQNRDSFLFNTEREGVEGVLFRNTEEDEILLELADNTVNFVELFVEEIVCAPDTVAIWDASANGGEGAEFTQTVDTVTAQKVSLVSNTIAFSGDGDRVPLAIVTTTGGVISNIEDARRIFWELEEDFEFGPTVVTRTDRNIETLKEAYDAITTAIREGKGSTKWFDLPWASARILKEYQNMFISGGGGIAFDGDAGMDMLEWGSDLTIRISGRIDSYIIDAAKVTILDGQAMYVNIPDGAPTASIVPVIANIEDVPLDPSDATFEPGIQTLFHRIGNTIYGHMDIPELNPGETATIGVDLPLSIRTMLGIVDEANFLPYTPSALSVDEVVEETTSLPDAISNILDTIDQRLGQLRLIPHPTNTNRAIVTGVNRSLRSGVVIGQEVINTVLDFSGAEIDFSTGEVFETDGTTPFNAGASNFTPASITPSEYIWYAVQLVSGDTNPNNTVRGELIISPAPVSNAVVDDAPRSLFNPSSLKLGEIAIQESGGSIAPIEPANIIQIGLSGGSVGGSEFDAVVGVGGTHEGLQELMDDPRIEDFKNILVTSPITLSAPVILNRNDMRFNFKPQAVIVGGIGALQGLVVAAERVRIDGGRFINFDTVGANAIEMLNTSRYCMINNNFFLNCDTTIVNDGTLNNLNNNIEEV